MLGIKYIYSKIKYKEVDETTHQGMAHRIARYV